MANSSRSTVRFKLNAIETEVYNEFVQAIQLGELQAAVHEKRQPKHRDHNTIAKALLFRAIRKAQERAIAEMKLQQQPKGTDDVTLSGAEKTTE